MSEENKNEILTHTSNAVPVEGSEENINESSVTASEEKTFESGQEMVSENRMEETNEESLNPLSKEQMDSLQNMKDEIDKMLLDFEEVRKRECFYKEQFSLINRLEDQMQYMKDTIIKANFDFEKSFKDFSNAILQTELLSKYFDCICLPNHINDSEETKHWGDILKQVIEEDAQGVMSVTVKVQLNKLEPNTSFPLPLNIPYWRVKTSVFVNPLFNKLANTQTKQFFLYFKYLDGVESRLKSLLLKILQMDKYGPLYDKRAEVFSVFESESLILALLTKDEDISEESIKEIQSSLVHRMDIGNNDDYELQRIIDAAQELIDKLKILTRKDSMIDNLLYDYTSLFQNEVDGLIKLLYKNVFADLYRLVNAIRIDLNKVAGLITEDFAEMRWSEMLCSMRTIWMNYLLTLNVSIHNEVTHGTKYDDVEEFCDIVATEPQSEYETGIIQEATALGFDLNLPGYPKVILEKTKVVAYCKV